MRVKWIDITKFFGIFAIYLGHYQTNAGHAYGFVFSYHVALFFFLSGCMNSYDNETNYGKYVWKKFKSIMVPFWIFSFLSIVIYIIDTNGSLWDVAYLVTRIARGNIRNEFVASSLWFLSCLFVIELIFKLLKYLKNKILIFMICLVLFWVSNTLIVPDPIVFPHWWYNIDSAFYYIIYFAIGYVSYPIILWLFKYDTNIKKYILWISGIASFVYSALLFLGESCIVDCLDNVLGSFAVIVSSCITIWLNCLVAKLLEDIQLFQVIGKETLYLCGNEYLIKTIVNCILQVFGMSIQANSPLTFYILTMSLLIVGVKLVIPYEKKLIGYIMNKICKK